MTEIDATGLHCPMPVLRLQKALRDMKSGERIRLLATDKMASVDVPHFCSEHGHALIASRTQKNAAPDGGDLLIFEIEKNA